MKLDDRIIDRKYIFDCFTSDKAKQFIGEKGYFAGDLYCFNDVQQLCAYGTLVNVLDDMGDSFQRGEIVFPYFIPECSLKPKENKFRPYTLTEFKNKFTVGRSFYFRKKGEDGCEVYSILSGYRHEQYKDQTITYIYIGYCKFTLDELFNDYEWQDPSTPATGDWKPFGIEEVTRKMESDHKIALKEICHLLWSMNSYIRLCIVNPCHVSVFTNVKLRNIVNLRHVSVFTNVELAKTHGGEFADYIVTDVESDTHNCINVFLEKPAESRKKCLEKAL